MPESAREPTPGLLLRPAYPLAKGQGHDARRPALPRSDCAQVLHRTMYFNPLCVSAIWLFQIKATVPWALAVVTAREGRNINGGTTNRWLHSAGAQTKAKLALRHRGIAPARPVSCRNMPRMWRDGTEWRVSGHLELRQRNITRNTGKTPTCGTAHIHTP